jgi:hypothetical protein
MDLLNLPENEGCSNQDLAVACICLYLAVPCIPSTLLNSSSESQSPVTLETSFTQSTNSLRIIQVKSMCS